MAYTDVDTIAAIMSKSFDTTTTPSSSQVTDIIIPLSDAWVDSDNISGASTNQLKLLSTLIAAHIITVAKDVDFRSADVNISIKNQSSSWLKLYQMMTAKKQGSFFRVVNQ